MNRMRTNRVVATTLAVALAVLGGACGSSDKPATASKLPNGTVTVKQWSVTLNKSSFAPGKYRFAIMNTGTIPHELIAFRTDLALEELPMSPTGDVNEDDPALTSVTDGDDIGVGKTQMRVINLPTEGTYVFMCNLPGHFKSGMHEVITVKSA